MKVLIIDTAPRDMATYLSPYIKACEDLNVEYDRFIWDRNENGEIEYIGHEIIYHGRAADVGVSQLKKIYPLYRCRLALKHVLREGNYTHLILVNTIAAVILFGFIRRYFKDRYIMDIRDYTYEKYFLYRRRVDQLIMDSSFSVISSRGFYRFLKDNDKIVIAHNISNQEDIVKESTLQKEKINTIGFVGRVRYEKENWRLIETFANDKSYRLLYAGGVMPGCNLEELCEQRKISNISFWGKFENREKRAIYEHIDIINSLYGNFSLEVTTAVPNRYYDAIIYKKPILASSGTYLGELVREKNLGIVVDIFHDDVKQSLKTYIEQFNKSCFEHNCNEELDRVLIEQNIYENKIRRFLTGEHLI